MTPISHYYHGKNRLFEKSFIVNYANISEKESDYIINVLSKIIL
ncbi:putative transcriptional regulator of pyridoxine metabolism [Streptococcus sp. HSISB1]|nr:putative transcriptional regulator of pyridoxine metabolism [Streptococcus sp. HSISB1]